MMYGICRGRPAGGAAETATSLMDGSTRIGRKGQAYPIAPGAGPTRPDAGRPHLARTGGARIGKLSGSTALRGPAGAPVVVGSAPWPDQAHSVRPSRSYRVLNEGRTFICCARAARCGQV